MNLKELKDNSRKMIKSFVDAIGLDGEMYSQINKTPVGWGKIKINGSGKFISPHSKELEEMLEKNDYDEKIKKELSENGIILLNHSYKNMGESPDLYITLIHETLHANRDLLIFDSIRDGENENSYTYNNGKFEQNSDDYDYTHADFSQDILKESIYTSEPTINKYKLNNSGDIDLNIEIKNKKLEQQKIVDEALIELMAQISYKLYLTEQKGEKSDIWKIIEHAKNVYQDEDLGVISEIILKHHDFNLFKWILDPLTYSQEDIHYDYFKQYTKNDKDLVTKLYKAGELLNDGNDDKKTKSNTEREQSDLDER